MSKQDMAHLKEKKPLLVFDFWMEPYQEQTWKNHPKDSHKLWILLGEFFRGMEVLAKNQRENSLWHNHSKDMHVVKVYKTKKKIHFFTAFLQKK